MMNKTVECGLISDNLSFHHLAALRKTCVLIQLWNMDQFCMMKFGDFLVVRLNEKLVFHQVEPDDLLEVSVQAGVL